MDYLDFDLEIGVGKGRKYPLAVVRSPAGEARETMQFPFDELALENQLLRLQNVLLRSGGERRQILSPDEQTVQNFGRTLFEALFTGEVGTRYVLSQREAVHQGKGLRLKLRIQSPKLAALPWEFLYNVGQAEYVCLSSNTPIVRYLELQQPPQPLSVRLPLRILGMVASPKDLADLGVEREKQRVEKALQHLQAKGMVELTWLPGQTWQDLQRIMQRGPWHIFHFIGHGGFDPNTDEGLIALEDDEGRTQHLKATLLGRLLADHLTLRLVVLNSCEGARGSEKDIFSSTAAILVRRGIPAVLAMQYEITDRAAIELSRAFYEALANSLPVDMAVSEARKAISVGVVNTVEWGTPVLYMHSPDGVLFDLIQNPAIQEEQPAHGSVPSLPPIPPASPAPPRQATPDKVVEPSAPVVPPSERSTAVPAAAVPDAITDSSASELFTVPSAPVSLSTTGVPSSLPKSPDAPSVPSPLQLDQNEGDVADIPFFPNPRIEEEMKVDQVGEERIPEAEEEQVRRPQSPGQEAVIAWIAANQSSQSPQMQRLTKDQSPQMQRLLSPEQLEMQQLIKSLSSEKEVKVWIEKNPRLLSPEKIKELQSPSEEAVNAWIEESRSFLNDEKIKELQQRIKSPSFEEEVNAWIEKNPRLMSLKKKEELQQLIKSLSSEKEVKAKFLSSEKEVNAWIEQSRSFLNDEIREELQRLINNYKRDSLPVHFLRIKYGNLSSLVASMSLEIREELQKLTENPRLLGPEQREMQQLIKSLSSEEAVNAWIEENRSSLSPEIREELQKLIKNRSSLSPQMQRQGRRRKRLLSREQMEMQQLIEFLSSKKAVNAWIEREKNKGHLNTEIIGEVQELIEKFRPLSPEEIEELQKLIENQKLLRAEQEAMQEAMQKAQEARQKAQEARRKRFTRVTWIAIVLNLLGTSVWLGILLHAWWIAMICLIGELLLAWIMLGSLEKYLSFHWEKALLPPFLLVRLLPVGIAWGLVGWFLNPFISLQLHFLYSTLILAAFGFLLGLFVNFFIYLPLVRGLRLENRESGHSTFLHI